MAAFKYRFHDEHEVLHAAAQILHGRLREQAVPFTSPDSARDYLTAALGGKEREEFVCLWLDSQLRLIESEVAFVGTISQTAVYPREIVKSALRLNAAAVIFAHNHPSGVAEPSRADELLTQSLKQALGLVDVRVLDHVVIAGSKVVSFAERGII